MSLDPDMCLFCGTEDIHLIFFLQVITVKVFLNISGVTDDTAGKETEYL
jgi:hypothetical protein